MILIRIVSISILCILLGCTQEKNISYIYDTNNTQLRPDPGYIQYVRNRSLYTLSEKITRAVAGTSNIWNNTAPTPEELLTMASVWITVNPVLYGTDIDQNFFTAFTKTETLSSLHTAGIQGIYLSPFYGASYLWTDVPRLAAKARDAIQFEFPIELGTFDEFRTFRAAIGNQQMLIGTDIFPLAAGIGADFWLATHGESDYLDIFAMKSIPKEYWNILPHLEEPEHAVPLQNATVASLAEKGVLPKTIQQDTLEHFPKTGWAVTPPTLTVYGEKERYAYRYYDTPTRPLLYWHNASYSAKKILTASILQSISVQGVALLGIDATPYWGFSPIQTTQTVQSLDTKLFTKIVQELGTTVARYGTWSFNTTETPIPLLKTLLQHTAFSVDSITYPYAEYATLTGKTALLKQRIATALDTGIIFSQLIHTSTNEYGLPLFPMSIHNEQKQQLLSIHAALQSYIPKQYIDTKKGILTATMPSLIALAEKLPLQNYDSYTTKNTTAILNRHTGLLFFKAMLPGILMLSMQDIVAPLPRDTAPEALTSISLKDLPLSYTGYTLETLPYLQLVNKFGVPSGKTLYPPFAVQNLLDDSLIQRLSTILSLRKHYNIASMRMEKILETPTNLVALLLKSDTNHVLVVTNFSDTKYVWNPPKDLSITRAIASDGSSISIRPITLEPWSGALLILQ